MIASAENITLTLDQTEPFGEPYRISGTQSLYTWLLVQAACAGSSEAKP